MYTYAGHSLMLLCRGSRKISCSSNSRNLLAVMQIIRRLHAKSWVTRHLQSSTWQRPSIAYRSAWMLYCYAVCCTLCAVVYAVGMCCMLYKYTWRYQVDVEPHQSRRVLVGSFNLTTTSWDPCFPCISRGNLLYASEWQAQILYPSVVQHRYVPP